MKVLCVKDLYVAGKLAAVEGERYDFEKVEVAGQKAYKFKTDTGWGVVSKKDQIFKEHFKKLKKKQVTVWVLPDKEDEE